MRYPIFRRVPFSGHVFGGSALHDGDMEGFEAATQVAIFHGQFTFTLTPQTVHLSHCFSSCSVSAVNNCIPFSRFPFHDWTGACAERLLLKPERF